MAVRKKATPKSLYTDPALRERLKNKIMAGDKGGRKGQWSARKAQLLAAEYEKAGGRYTGQRRAGQKHLTAWTKEHWQTQSGDARAQHGSTTNRYLPEKAWEQLSPAEKKATNSKKRKASKTGNQFVANTAAAKLARKKSVAKSAKR